MTGRLLLRRILGTCAVFLLLFAGSMHPAAAQEVGNDSMDGCSPSWTRQFDVDILILDCAPGYATPHDRAYMYARTPVDTAADWRSQADFTNATWVFDAGARGKASLIIDFYRNESGLVADIFDDVSRDGEVRYGLERGYPRSVETRFPTVRVVARDGWWARDGRINYNLQLTVDGTTPAAFHYEVFQEFTQTDGQPDATIEVGNPSGSGRPQWQIVQATPPVSESSAIFRSLVMVNTADDEIPIDSFVLWPHLGYYGERRSFPEITGRAPLSTIAGAGYGIVKNYNESFPPIQIDWEQSTVAWIGEFVASRARPTNWFIYSVNRLDKDSGVANFETPFAFYNLSGIDDGYPDLIIRDQFISREDSYAEGWFPDGPYHDIRYSWDPDHKKRLGYKLGVSGRQVMPSVVRVGDLAIESVAYDAYPKWVVDNTWDAVTFVANEMQNFWTTEGIYDWCSMCSPEQGHYASGTSSQKPLARYSDIAAGRRGEYITYLGDVPRLYASSIDEKLHLFRAEGGVWRLNDSDRLLYRSLTDEYINRWDREIDGVVTQSLLHLADRVILAEPGVIRIGRGPDSPVLFTTRPPANPEGWQHHRALLSQLPPPGAGTNLASIFERFTQERIELTGATLWDARPEGDGFRFVVHLTRAMPEVSWIGDIEPGTYTVAYKPQTGFELSEISDSRATWSEVRVEGDAPVSNVPTRLSVEITNAGNRDVPSLPLAFFAARPGQTGQVIAWTTVDVHAEGTATAEVIWIPADSGEWEIRTTSIWPDASASPSTRIEVREQPPTDLASLFLAQGLRPFAGGAISASLTLVAAISIGLGFIIWRANEDSTVEDEHR